MNNSPISLLNPLMREDYESYGLHLGFHQSMVNRNENPFDWTTELHDHHFWKNFQADWYLTVVKE
jgi:hypothetical protein